MLYITGKLPLHTYFAQVVREYTGPPIVPEEPFIEEHRYALAGFAAATGFILLIIIVLMVRRSKHRGH